MPLNDQGVFQDRYTIIPRVLIFATKQDSVLLIKGAPTKRLWANLYNGIGGHIEQGEDVLAAAHREFKEETGLSLLNPWLSAVITIDTQKSIGIGMYVFRGEAQNGDIKSSKEGAPEWIPTRSIHQLPLVEDLPILIPKILSLQKHSPPLFAQYAYDQDDKLTITFNQ